MGSEEARQASELRPSSWYRSGLLAVGRSEGLDDAVSLSVPVLLLARAKIRRVVHVGEACNVDAMLTAVIKGKRSDCLWLVAGY